MCKYLCLNQGYYVERDNTFCSGRNLRKHRIIFFSPSNKSRQPPYSWLCESLGKPQALSFLPWRKRGLHVSFQKPCLAVSSFSACDLRKKRSDSSLSNFKERLKAPKSLVDFLEDLHTVGKKGCWRWDIQVHHLLDIPVETDFIFEIRGGQNGKVYPMSAPGFRMEAAFSVPSFFFLMCSGVFSGPASLCCVAVGRWLHLLCSGFLAWKLRVLMPPLGAAGFVEDKVGECVCIAPWSQRLGLSLNAALMWTQVSLGNRKFHLWDCFLIGLFPDPALYKSAPSCKMLLFVFFFKLCFWPTLVIRLWGVFWHQPVLQHQVGVQWFHSVQTLMTWSQYRPPQLKGSVP